MTDLLKILALCFSLLVLQPFIQAQEKLPMNCGTHTTADDIALLLKNKKYARDHVTRSMETTWIPIQFHLVGTSAGLGRVRPDKVLAALCKLNSDFLMTGMQFYFNGEFKTIDNSAMYEMNYPPIPSGVRTQFALKRVDGAVNVFVGSDLASGNSGFYTSGVDIIYINQRYLDDDDVILAHELGHFLGLPHTFFGWEDTDYDPNSPTPTQVFRGSNSYDVEYVDRELNCESSGDFFCGTPADYILSWNGGCNYTGGAVDPDSVLLDPDETNFMAYFSFTGCEQFTFADDQSMAMVANYMNRGEFSGTNVPDVDELSGPSALILPEEDAVVSSAEVELSWEAPENAEHHIVQISRLPSFFAIEQQQVLAENEITFFDLLPNKLYYWRVISFNSQHTCDLIESESRSFTTSQNTSTTDISNSEDLKVLMNPLKSDENITLLSPKDLGQCRVTSFSISGAKLGEVRQIINEGSNTIRQLLQGESGSFIIRIESEKVSKSMRILKI